MKKEGYWSGRFGHFLASFKDIKPKDFIKIIILDFIFVFLLITTLFVFVNTAAYNLKNMDTLALNTLSLAPKLQQPDIPTDIAAEIQQIKSDFHSVLFKFAIVALIYLVMLCIILSLWNYIAFTLVEKHRFSIKGFFRFLVIFSIFIVMMFAILILALLTFPIKVGVFTGLFVLLLTWYLGIILSASLVHIPGKGVIRRAFSVGIKKINISGFGFIVSILILVLFNLFAILLKSVNAVLFFVYFIIFISFISWSRNYVASEIKSIKGLK